MKSCVWTDHDAPDAEGRRRVRCEHCGFTSHPTASPLSRIFRHCEIGPGSELTALLAEMGITSKPKCGCKALARQMDVRGVEWCRENRQSVLDQLHEHSHKWSWAEKLKVGAIAAWNGLPLSLGALYDEAVRRAEAKAAGTVG